MEPRRRGVVSVVGGALLVVIALWIIVRILEAIWVPLLVLGLVLVALGAAGWILYHRMRRW